MCSNPCQCAFDVLTRVNSCALLKHVSIALHGSHLHGDTPPPCPEPVHGDWRLGCVVREQRLCGNAQCPAEGRRDRHGELTTNCFDCATSARNTQIMNAIVPFAGVTLVTASQDTRVLQRSNCSCRLCIFLLHAVCQKDHGWIAVSRC